MERGRRDELSQRRRARRSLSPFSDALVAAIGHSHRSRKRSRLRSRSLSRRRSTERRRSNSDESGRNRSRNREVLEPSYDERRRKEKTRRQRRRKHRERQRSSTRSPSSGSPPPQAQGAPNGTGTGVVSDDEEQGNIRSTGRAEHIPMDNFTRARGREASSSDEPTARPTSKSHNESLGHFQGGNGTVIADRYKIIREVGLGTFGRVIECSDLKHSDQSQRDCHRDKASVAIKIVRKIKRYYDSALIEADIVDAVNRRGGRGLTHCVVLHDAFSFAGHFCLVFESLGPSLYDFLKRHNYQSFPMACVQDFTVQLLEALVSRLCL